MPAAELVDQVGSLGTTSVDTVAFRHVSPTIDPRSGTGARIHGGRWNPPGSYATLYFGTDVETVIEEFHRLARRQGLDVGDFVPRDLCRFHVHLESILDLTASESRAAVGLSDALLRRDDPTYCQAIGEAAHYLGLEGIVVPSAAGPGTVLAVFLGRLGAGSSLELLEVTRWDEPPPLPERGVRPDR